MKLSDRLREFREVNARARSSIGVNRPRKHQKRRRQQQAKDPKFLAWMHTQPCLVAARGGCSGVLTFHHLRSVGGRKDDRVGLPLCAAHHLHGAGPDAIHRLGKVRFQERFDVDLEAEAARYWALWEEQR